ncbi:dolichol-phosphate mannosyltransferase [Micrococcales bacterium KH10]|nr:dolichol-phosphate mannosyltransferase [Micrococcales bacterium KH10]
MTTEDARVLVMMPTFNEATTLPVTVAGVLDQAPEINILVIDDASPDGTGLIADRLADEDERIQVLHRSGKQGLGTAYVAGIRWGLERGYDVLVEMDADGSHRPEDLPKLLRVLAAYPDAAAVLGSRWISGGATQNWPRRRQYLSRAGNRYVRIVLGMPIGDATGGFRAYRTEALTKMNLGSIASQGYCFQVDMVWRLIQAGERVIEVPIVFVERHAGQSKMSNKIVRESLVRVTAWGLKHRARQIIGAERRNRKQ